MRDLIVLVVLGGGALYALYRPWVGAMLWTWVSLMSPHVEFGYRTGGMPVAAAIAGTTLVGLLFTREKHNPFVGPSMVVLAAFVLWTGITLPFSFYFDDSWNLFVRSIKIFLMLFVTVALIDSRKKLEVFIWVCAFSIGFYGLKGGAFTLATGGNFRVWGPGGFVGGNNEIAAALVMTVPLIRYLQMQQSSRWVQHGMTVWMLLCIVAALGSYSRGALLASGVMAFFLWTKGRNKLFWAAIFVVGVVAFLPMLPESWWERMNTIKVYDRDDSALGRINAWWNAFNVANSNLFGGGFMIYKPEVFLKYAPDPNRVHAAHSIYFQILGEHGWIGLVLFMGIAISGWRTGNRIIRLRRLHPEIATELQWAVDLSRMIQVSLIGFGAGGAFLSLAYFDLPYNLIAAVAVAHWLCQRIIAERLASAAPQTWRTAGIVDDSGVVQTGGGPRAGAGGAT